MKAKIYKNAPFGDFVEIPTLRFPLISGWEHPVRKQFVIEQIAERLSSLVADALKEEK